MEGLRRKRLKRQLDSIIIHFDYDCFYASVIEHENPALRSLPLAVQQKQIVVTCNYEARRRGLYKLQLVKEAKKICPDVVIVLGEDLTRFRNASKELYGFLKSFSWNSKVDRLGFDEVFMDVSDIISYNVGLLNPNDLANSFFCLSRTDPAVGFAYDASLVAGYTYPEEAPMSDNTVLCSELQQKLILGSHLAQYLRFQLEKEKGYTCTVGISTNKLLAKLVGNLHKPNDQTTLLPPYFSEDDSDNVTSFIDGHEVGKIPGIGFKLAQKIRTHVLGRDPKFQTGLVYGGTKENVLVSDVRKHPGIGPETLESILGGPGSPHGIGAKVWGLLNGFHDTEVGLAREVPKQISIEDSYLRLDSFIEVVKELRMLANSLLNRMHADLLEDDEDEYEAQSSVEAVALSDSVLSTVKKRWMAYPKTLRLSTRPRPAQNPDGSRNRSFARISRSAPMPNFVFSLKDDVDALTERLVVEALIPLFRKLHPEKSGWNLSLVNLAATNMVDSASDKGGVGRDISKMFKRQDDFLRPWKVTHEEEFHDVSHDPDGALNLDIAIPRGNTPHVDSGGSEDLPTASQEHKLNVDMEWEADEDDDMEDSFRCEQCSAVMPLFAMAAHARWHSQESGTDRYG